MTENKPQIGICLATYNGEKYIEEQLKSIFSQTYQHFKLYISDDNSSDRTLEVVRAFQKLYPEQIDVMANRRRLGVVRNFEQILLSCNEKYIALCDQDDIWANDKLEKQLNVLIEHEKANMPILVHSDLKMIDSKNHMLYNSYFRYRKIKLTKNKSVNKIISHNGVMGCSVLMNSTLVEMALPFPQKLDVHDYWLALVNEVFGIRITIEQPLVNYRIHENNTSNSINKLTNYKKNRFLSSLFNDKKLPFIGIERNDVLREFLSRFVVNKEDKKIIQVFIDYLEYKQNWLATIYNLIRFNIIRNDIRYRTKILIKLIQRVEKQHHFLFSTSQELIKNIANFHTIRNYSFLEKFTIKCSVFYGWGRKRSGQKAIALAKKCETSFVLVEDGFIRSVGLGIDDSPAFSIVEDDIGIYYDAMQPSKLENLLSTYDFGTDTVLMERANEAIELIKKHHVSKYNHAPDMNASYFHEDKYRVLVIAQTAGDASLKYGLAGQFTTDEIIDAAITENPEAIVYLKVHPDVLSGKKKSDIDIKTARKKCTIIDEDLNPISLLEHFDKVYTKTSQMGFEALLIGKECVCFGMPFYAGWGLTDDRVSCTRRRRVLSVEQVFAAAYILYSRYYNPYAKRESDIIDTIQTIVRYRNSEKKTDTKTYFFGFSTWKHPFIKPFMKSIPNLTFINPLFYQKPLRLAHKKGLDKDSHIYIWGKKMYSEVEEYASMHHIPIYRVEDGFIRSVGLGSDLTQPYSLVIDSRGIYFDPTQESDLEHLLNFHPFTPEELTRAKQLRTYLIEKKLSKYNNYNDAILSLPKDRKIVLVPGQVEDDASIRFGAGGMSNLKLLKHTRENAPDAFIIYKPHPDVVSGNRVGDIKEEIALDYCNRVVTEVSLDTVLSVCDEVHTMTSLVGFEAIIREITVYTYGLPFYAGWGLSIDMQQCVRRKRQLLIDELTAATLLLYPRYIDPLTNESCDIEVTLIGIQQEKEKLDNSLFYRNLFKVRNFISRKSQMILRFFS